MDKPILDQIHSSEKGTTGGPWSTIPGLMALQGRGAPFVCSQPPFYV